MKYMCTCGEPLVYLLVNILVAMLILWFNLGKINRLNITSLYPPVGFS